MEWMGLVGRDAAALLGDVECSRVEMQKECWVDLATRRASKLWAVSGGWHCQRPHPSLSSLVLPVAARAG